MFRVRTPRDKGVSSCVWWHQMGRGDDERVRGPCRGQTLLRGLQVDQPVAPYASPRARESVRPHARRSVGASAVPSPSGLRSSKTKGRCCLFPPPLPGCPNREVLKDVTEALGSGGYLPGSPREG